MILKSLIIFIFEKKLKIVNTLMIIIFDNKM